MKNRIITRLAKQNIIANVVSEFKGKWVVDKSKTEMNLMAQNGMFGIFQVFVQLPEKYLYDKSPEEIKEIVSYFQNPDESDLSMFPLKDIIKEFNDKLKQEKIKYTVTEDDLDVYGNPDLKFDLDTTLKNVKDPLYIIFTLNPGVLDEIDEIVEQMQ